MNTHFAEFLSDPRLDFTLLFSPLSTSLWLQQRRDLLGFMVTVRLGSVTMSRSATCLHSQGLRGDGGMLAAHTQRLLSH